MSELLRGVAAANEGVFTAAHARSLGVADKELARLVAAGTCERVRRGAYAFVDETATMPSERHLLAAAGALAHHDGVVLSHHSAALGSGLPTWGVPYRQVRCVRLTYGHTTSSRTLAVGKPWPEDAYAETDIGMRTVTPAVCCLQIAMAYGVEQAVVSLDAALAHKLTSVGELAAWLDRLRGHRHVSRARRAVALADGRSESPGESRLRIRLQSLGYTGVVPQVRIRSGGRLLGRVDLYDKERRVVAEFDGRVKYAGDEGGEAVFAEKLREDDLRRLGLGVARYVWSDLDSYDTLRSRFEQATRSARATKVSYAEGA